MTIIVSLLVCLVGLVIYLVTTPPPGSLSAKINVLALYAYWVGLLAFLLEWPGSRAAVSILGR